MHLFFSFDNSTIELRILEAALYASSDPLELSITCLVLSFTSLILSDCSLFPPNITGGAISKSFFASYLLLPFLLFPPLPHPWIYVISFRISITVLLKILSFFNSSKSFTWLLPSFFLSLFIFLIARGKIICTKP